MTRFYNSLQFRLTLSFLIMMLIIAGFSYFYTYLSARDAIRESTRDQLIQASEMLASQFTQERINLLLSFKKGDEQTPEFREFLQFVVKFRQNIPDLANFYIIKKEKDKILFLLDDLLVEEDSDAAPIGEEYTDYESELLEAFDGRTTASKDFYTDKWGTFLSGYAPVRDMKGNVVMAVGIDMLVTKALEKQAFIGSLVYYVIGVSILSGVLFIFFFSATIIRDIKLLKRAAQKISEGDIRVEIPDIKSRNEIRELSEAMKSVMAAVTQLREIAAENGEHHG